MSLKVGKAVIAALRSNRDLLTKLGGTGSTLSGARIFAVARSTEDDNLDKIPYVVIIPRGVNTDGTKDGYEGLDVATIDVLCVDSTYSDLVDLTEMVRETLPHMDEEQDGYIINDYSFSAGEVFYDMSKPCYYQTLTYQISTQNDED